MKYGDHGDFGTGIFVYAKSTDSWLFLQRSDKVLEPLKVNISSGWVEESDKSKPYISALRELYEETKYTGKIDLIFLYELTEVKEPSNKIFTFYNYIGIIENEFTPTLNWENIGYIWVKSSSLEKEMKLICGDFDYALQAILFNWDDENLYITYPGKGKYKYIKDYKQRNMNQIASTHPGLKNTLLQPGIAEQLYLKKFLDNPSASFFIQTNGVVDVVDASKIPNISYSVPSDVPSGKQDKIIAKFQWAWIIGIIGIVTIIIILIYRRKRIKGRR